MYGNLMVDVGFNERATNKGVQEAFRQHSNFVSISTHHWASSCSLQAVNAENTFLQENPDIPTTTKSRDNIESDLTDDLLASLVRDENGMLIFNCIFITSRDRDNWYLLKRIIFTDPNDYATLRNDVRVQCIVFHGTPELYTDGLEDVEPKETEFLKLVRGLRNALDEEDTKMYFASYVEPIVADFDTSLQDKTVLPTLYYIGKRDGHHRYADCDDILRPVPFADYLRIRAPHLNNPAHKGPVIAELIPHVLNHHHKKVLGHWTVPSERGNYNEDVALVGLFIGDASILLLGDASRNIQENYLKVLKIFHLVIHWTLILVCHNSTSHRAAFYKDIFLYANPRGVIMPVFYKQGYPIQKLFKFFEQMDLAVVQGVNNGRHKVYCYNCYDVLNTEVYVEPEMIEGQELPLVTHQPHHTNRKFFEEIKVTSKCLFSLHKPLTLRFAGNNIYIGQDSTALSKVQRDMIRALRGRGENQGGAGTDQRGGARGRGVQHGRVRRRELRT